MCHGPPIFLRRHDAGTLGKNRAKDPLRRKGSKAVRKIRKNFPNFPPPFHGSGKAPSQATASLLALCFPSGTKNRQKHGKSIRGRDATPPRGVAVGIADTPRTEPACPRQAGSVRPATRRVAGPYCAPGTCHWHVPAACPHHRRQRRRKATPGGGLCCLVRVLLRRLRRPVEKGGPLYERREKC